MRKKNGQALITVLVFIAVFVALIAAVVIVVTVSYKRATYSHNKLIAQQIAETGIQDALYKLNYKYHDPTNYYGFVSGQEITLNPASGAAGSCQVSPPIPPPSGYLYNNYEIPATLLGIPDASASDGANVLLTININGSPDILKSVGTYKGTQVTISTDIKTLSTLKNLSLPLSDSTNNDTKGIPEAFNKHVIYANIVNGKGAAGSVVTGNITCNTWEDTGLVGQNTQTETAGISTPILSTSVTSSMSSIPTPLPLPSVVNLPPSDSNTGGYDYFYANISGTTYYDTGGGWVSPVPPSSGATYSDTTLYWTFTTYTPTSGNSIYVLGNGSPTSGNAIINENFTIWPSYFLADGNITISSPISPGNSILEPCIQHNGSTGNLLTINSGVTITGNLLVTSPNTPTIYINGTLDGALISSNSSIGVQGTGSINMPSSLSTMPAAILIDNTSGSTTSDTVTLTSTPTITLGPKQISAIMAYSSSGGNVGVNISSPLTLTYSNLPQAAIITYTTGSTTGTAAVTIWNNINSLVYAYAAGPPANANIKLSGGNVFGSLVTSGTVTLNGGTLNWDPIPYKTNTEVYNGFIGGQRVFVPENWKITW